MELLLGAAATAATLHSIDTLFFFLLLADVMLRFLAYDLRTDPRYSILRRDAKWHLFDIFGLLLALVALEASCHPRKSARGQLSS